jgi:hypothetical protein
MRDLTLTATKTNLKDGTDFPLFSKGQDRARFQVFFLKKRLTSMTAMTFLSFSKDGE